MAKKILMESTKSKFKVLDKKPANVLKRIQGVLSDFKSNRNGRIYNGDALVKGLSAPEITELINNKKWKNAIYNNEWGYSKLFSEKYH